MNVRSRISAWCILSLLLTNCFFGCFLELAWGQGQCPPGKTCPMKTINTHGKAETKEDSENTDNKDGEEVAAGSSGDCSSGGGEGAGALLDQLGQAAPAALMAAMMAAHNGEQQGGESTGGGSGSAPASRPSSSTVTEPSVTAVRGPGSIPEEAMSSSSSSESSSVAVVSGSATEQSPQEKELFPPVDVQM